MKQDSTPLPEISIVMAAYNCEPFIEKAIMSVLKQTYEGFEFLICDDFSTDNTLSIINSVDDQRVRTFRNEHNLGYLKTTNRLLRESRGQLITFQDADDWSHPDRLKLLLEAFTNDKQLSLCGSYCVKVAPTRSKTIKYPARNKDLKRAVATGEIAIFCGASLMFRRSLYEKIGGYDLLFDRIGSEDVDWYLRAVKNGKAANLQVPLYFYRQHQFSQTQSMGSNLLKYYSGDIAYALHLLRLKQTEGMLKDGFESFDGTIRRLFNPDINRLAFIEQAALHNFDRALLALSMYRKKNGVLSSLSLFLYGLAVACSVSLLPRTWLRRVVSRKRRERARLIVGEICR